jgi:hypothetical protein
LRTGGEQGAGCFAAAKEQSESPGNTLMQDASPHCGAPATHYEVPPLGLFQRTASSQHHTTALRYTVRLKMHCRACSRGTVP